ncbi:nuclear transport factor 2 family protein [Saprospiraceae bacterium]|nr:nuclear transport factor 2 family protein [Saprospiraceae bacterium]
MKSLILFILLISLSTLGTTQTTHDRIEATIMDYIDGTSYNLIPRIQNAFHSESDLFLDGKDDSIRIVPSGTYISWFEKNKPGEFNGRVGNILSIESFGNIATAKAEILLPHRNLRFVDMFILKEELGQWKIISKTANSEKSNMNGERVLFITSNARFYGNTDIKTGNSLSEIINAYTTFREAGYIVDFVSPEGGDIPIAYIDFRDDRMMKNVRDSEFMYRIAHTKKIGDIKAEDYMAVYFVGGGSAMFNVPMNKEIQTLAMSIYEEHNGVIASVCHGTAGIVNLKTKDGKYLVDGKRISGYPDEYERKDDEYYKTFPFAISPLIRERGGDFQYSPRNTIHIEAQDNVVTGQNHLSSEAVAEKVIELLKK